MKSISDIIWKYIDWNWRVTSCIWAYFLTAFYYVISFFIPKLREILTEYETDGTSRSVTIINLTVTNIWMGILLYLQCWVEPTPIMRFLADEGLIFLLMYIFGVGMGYVSLFTFADYMKKRKADNSN